MAVSPPSSLAGHAAAHLFQPPKSPATTNVTPSFASSGDYFSAGSRKRQRPDSARAHDRFQNQEPYLRTRQTEWTETPSWVQCPTPSDPVYGSAYLERESAFVNERYRLAGGFDTPSLRATHHASAIDDEHEFRRRMRDDDMDRFSGADCAPSFGPLARERNGAARMLSSDNEGARNTWAGLAFGAIGIVGKVFSFGTTVVRGFYAGGGKGYDLNDQQRFGTMSSDALHHQAACIPGSWQHDDDVLGESEQSSPYGQSFQERPPNKRRQTDRDEWVVIGTPDVEGVPSLKRRISSNVIPRSSPGPARPTASRASSRRSIAPVPRRTSSYANANGSPAQRTTLQTGGHSRRASFASPRSPHAQHRPSSGGSGAGQMSPEAERFAKRQAKQERQVDKAMTSMEQRMKEMIKQAQQALGTKYSVEGDDNMDIADDGFSSDEGW